jgi:integrase
MPLTLYRRHRKGCEASRPEGSFTGEFEESRRGAKRCSCVIHVSGTLAGKFNRKRTGCCRWDETRAAAAQWEAAGNWSGLIQPPEAPPPAPATTSGVSIADATEAYLARCENRGIQPTTLSKYRTFIKQLREFCDARGYIFIHQLTVADMDRFYASWKDGKRAKSKKLERLKSFVRFCLKREWLSRDIAEDLEAPEGSSIPASKAPFTDEELARIYAVCDALGEATKPGPGYRNWSGEDVKDFIMLSLYTGLRISDIATFNIDERLHGNDVFLRMHKTRKELYTWIPGWLVARLQTRREKHGPMIFRTGASTVMRTMAELWRVKIGKVFTIAGPFQERPTPHRFRHTFVRILLEKGAPVADVAELIGDTEEIVRRHYAKWVPERQARLTKILREAFEDKPKPKVVAIR